jgi:hypothetical protein
LLDLTKDVRRTLDEIKGHAEALALGNFDETTFRIMLGRFKSASSGTSEIELLSKQMLGMPESNNLNAKLVQFKRTVTSRSASNPLTPSDLPEIEANFEDARKAIVWLQCEILQKQ